MASLSAGVQSRAATAQEALKENNNKMAALFNELSKAGIDKKDIQTNHFNIHPVISHPKAGKNRTPKITSYSVENKVIIRIRDMEKTGSVLAALVKAGANSISNLSFDISDKKARLDEVRKAALLDARQKANIYAETLGRSIKELVSLSEAGSPDFRPLRAAQALSMDMLNESEVPVSGGELKLSISIKTSWALKEETTERPEE